MPPSSWLRWQHHYSQLLRKITEYCLILVQQQEDTPETLFSIKIESKREQERFSKKVHERIHASDISEHTAN